jgi:hypothetical protein
MGIPGEVPRRRRRGNLENQIQAAVVDWAVAPNVIIFAVPNGGLRSKAAAAKLKRTGTLAGVPDLVVIAQPAGRAHGRVSLEQRSLMEQLTAAGAFCAVVRSIDDGCLALQAWGIPTRESKGSLNVKGER